MLRALRLCIACPKHWQSWEGAGRVLVQTESIPLWYWVLWYWVLWYCGIVILGIEVLQYWVLGIVVLWYCGIVVLWYCSIGYWVLWYCGIVVLQYWVLWHWSSCRLNPFHLPGTIFTRTVQTVKSHDNSLAKVMSKKTQADLMHLSWAVQCPSSSLFQHITWLQDTTMSISIAIFWGQWDLWSDCGWKTVDITTHIPSFRQNNTIQHNGTQWNTIQNNETQ